MMLESGEPSPTPRYISYKTRFSPFPLQTGSRSGCSLLAADHCDVLATTFRADAP